jgi:uncharacterized protein (TIGR03083 family)
MAPPVEPPADLTSLFGLERARLTELLDGVPEGAWRWPTPCPGWTVLGLCCHLVGDDLSLLARFRDGWHGTPAPEGLDDTQFIDWLDELQVAWVDAARRLRPRVAVDLLRWAGPQVADALGRLDPRARTAHVSWAGHDPVPQWLEQARQLSEYWIHRQQLLQALGRPSDLRADVLGPVLDGMRWAYPYRLAAVEARPGDAVDIEIVGPIAVTWRLVAADSGWTFRPEPGDADRRVAALSMSTEQAWRLLTNNLRSGDRAGMRLTGDPAVVEALGRTRAIIGSPA